MLTASYITTPEREAVTKLVDGALAKGFKVTVNNGVASTKPMDDREAILTALAQTSDDTLDFYEAGKLKGFAWLVWGNGDPGDLLASYTAAGPVQELVKQALAAA